MSNNSLPANQTLNVWVYEDGDSPRQLAHYVVLHEYGSPPDHTEIVVNDRRVIPIAPSTIRRAFPLQSVCDNEGMLRQIISQGVQLEISLTEWLSEHPERRKVFYYTGHWYRHDLFSDEQRQLMKAEQAEITARYNERRRSQEQGDVI
jgi:hypothetical protein